MDAASTIFKDRMNMEIERHLMVWIHEEEI
jgi:hypothetical protein